MARNKQSNEMALIEFTSALTGEEAPWADSGTKAISLRIDETNVFLAEALAEFGHKKRASILKAAVGFGLAAILDGLNEEDELKVTAIEKRIMMAAYGIEDKD
jgi:hypothetical protein